MEVAVTNLVSTLWTFSGLCSCASQRSKDVNVCRVRNNTRRNMNFHEHHSHELLIATRSTKMNNSKRYDAAFKLDRTAKGLGKGCFESPRNFGRLEVSL